MRGGLRGRLRTARHWVLLVGALTLVALLQLSGAGWGLGLADGGDRPTPQRAASEVPLGYPSALDDHVGPHHFLAVQDDGASPVTYDPCRPLRYVVNLRTAPPGAEGLLADAITTISVATGLRFQAEGTSDEPPVPDRPPFQPERYGDRWAPILLAWSDPTEVADLGGDVAGVGGSARIRPSGSAEKVYVSGMVALDGPQLTTMLRTTGGPAQVRGVLLHELAHVVGLAHVDDPTQLLHISSDLSELQAGDLAGLRRLGTGPCFPRL